MIEGAGFAGIDWASMLHVACVVDAGGEVVDRFDFAHDRPISADEPSPSQKRPLSSGECPANS